MRRARKEAGIQQHALARLIGTKQGIISRIESGKILASIYVPAIAVALEMPLPHTEIRDATDKTWIELGRAVRERSPSLFKRLLSFIEEDKEE